MKSLLAGMDKNFRSREARGHTAKHSTTASTSLTGGVMPTAGRSIKKLNIEELPFTLTPDIDQDLHPNYQMLNPSLFSGTGQEKRPASTTTKKLQQQLQEQPQQKQTSSFNHHIKMPPRSRGNTNKAGFENYDLLSKFDASVFNPDTTLTQQAVSRLKTDIKAKTQSKNMLKKMYNAGNVGPGSHIHSPRQAVTNVVGGIESDLGFGFGFRSDLDAAQITDKARDPSHLSGKQSHRKSASLVSGDVKVPNPQKIVQAAAKKTKASIQELNKKIIRKQEEWKTEEFGWDGYHYQGAIGGVGNSPGSTLAKDPLKTISTGPNNNSKNVRLTNGSADVPTEESYKNEKLSEMSRKFKDSLKVNTDMKRAIKTPTGVNSTPTSKDLHQERRNRSRSRSKSRSHAHHVRNSHNPGPRHKSRNIMESPSAESTTVSRNKDKRVANGRNLGVVSFDKEQSQGSSLLTRSSALYVPVKKSMATASANKGKTVKIDDRWRDSSQQKSAGSYNSGTDEESEHEKIQENRKSAKNPVDFAGLMKLRSLLESKKPDDRRKQNGLIDFNELKKVTSSLVTATAGKKSYKKGHSNVEKYDMGTSPRSSAVAGGGEVRVMSENYYNPDQSDINYNNNNSESTSSLHGSPRKYGYRVNTTEIPVDEFIKQRLGESVKTVDDASVIASRLGSLMTKVALSRNNNKDRENNNSTMGAVDTVSLAKELRELASSMEKDYGKDYPSPPGQEVQTQTDREFIKNLPEPKFTKRMSYTDQLVLRKLREVREKWRSDARIIEEQAVVNQ